MLGRGKLGTHQAGALLPNEQPWHGKIATQRGQEDGDHHEECGHDETYFGQQVVNPVRGEANEEVGDGTFRGPKGEESKDIADVSELSHHVSQHSSSRLPEGCLRISSYLLQPNESSARDIFHCLSKTIRDLPKHKSGLYYKEPLSQSSVVRVGKRNKEPKGRNSPLRPRRQCHLGQSRVGTAIE